LRAATERAIRAGDERLAAALRPIDAPGRAFAAAVRTQRWSAAAEHAHALAGLGVGSTPAGDDYLVGAMHALWATGRGERASDLAAVASPRTTTSSAYWLETAAGGQAAPAWLRLLRALAAGDGGTAAPAADAVLRCGHTSGVASLLGFLAVADDPRERP
jgi:hypothetical protein